MSRIKITIIIDDSTKDIVEEELERYTKSRGVSTFSYYRFTNHLIETRSTLIESVMESIVRQILKRKPIK